MVRVVIHDDDDDVLCSVVEGSVLHEYESGQYIYLSAPLSMRHVIGLVGGASMEHRLACRKRDPKEVMKPVRPDEVSQMVAPTRFEFDSRSHSHILIADFRFGNVRRGRV